MYKLLILCSLIAAVHLGAVEEDTGSSIPVIDFADYYAPEHRETFLNNLTTALKKVGFVAVKNSQINMNILDEGYAAFERFFNGNKEQKEEIFNPALNGQRGYVKSEIPVGQDLLDIKEHCHIGPTGNLWPSWMNLETPAMQLHRELYACSEAVAEAISLAMGMGINYLSEMFKDGENLMRPIHYPQNCPKGTIWAAEHTDIDLFTILPKSTADGLEVRDDQGVWHPVRVPEGSIIINVGDMLQNLTNGVFKSSVHRVRDPGKGEERYSIVFFIHPRGDCPMDPLTKFIDLVGEARYPTATRDEMLFERLANLETATEELFQLLSTSGYVERQIAFGQASAKVMLRLREYGLASPLVLRELHKRGL
ncbi:MAG: isopenicillin N synthase family oxygenase [Chlamydiales bacterium]|nr:isopenicillin N synthase family oxygenase [Chlamydiia bacterium]MCP5507206.1 isopenicillin N synthase family oxygenase [Chlamydiales bacterium]